MNRPSVRQLEYFVAVSRFGSFRRAAEELGISQPTITAQVAQLEKTLAVVLFERGRGGATPTPAGRQLLPIARRTLEELDNLLATAGTASSSGAAIYRLGVKSTLGPYILPRILPAVHARYRHLKLYVREEPPSRLEAALENGDLDLVLTALPTNSSELDGEQLLKEDIKLVMSADHPLADKPVLTPADLAGAQILTTQEGHKLTRMVEQIATRFGAEVLRDYEGTSLDALRLMVVMGMGIAFLPALYIRSEIKADSTLVVRDIEGESFARIIGLAWRSTSPARVFYRQLAQDMREVLREELGDVIQVLDRGS
ncbi:MAG: hydrogen peroxide-inducible genes activator [Halieaceae bacterium]|nr:hydrogen peroxide-inducible genes activator [Halieaceae bacterium]